MMKLFKKIVRHPNFWPLVIVLGFALLAGRDLLKPGYFNMHDDLQMMRQLEMEKCFLDGQIPCRWIPDMGYGFGFPLFNFYPPLPYLLGQGIRILGFSFVETVKLTFLLSFLVSGLSMYFLAKEFFLSAGRQVGRFGGVVSSVFYIWAPYHSVDIFVRGAMNEAWALAWFPLILLASYKLIKRKKNVNWVIGLALSWFALLTSHNLMALIFMPLFAGWCLIVVWRENKWNQIPRLVLSGILALGLAAFFTLPAVLETRYVQVNTLVAGYYEYIAHFKNTYQILFSRFWGYGPSAWLPKDDKMPFQIGHIHWMLSLVIAAFAVWGFWKNKKKTISLSSTPYLIILAFLYGWLSLFMIHSKSTPIWQAIPPLKFVQFPWRFLSVATLSFSFIAGSIALFVKKPLVLKIAGGILIVGLAAFNWNYFRAEKMGPLTDTQKFTGAAWELQQTAGIYDYLPKDAITAPKEPMKKLGEVLSGDATITEPKQGTNWASFTADVSSDAAGVRIGIFKFPNWKVFIDGEGTEVKLANDEQWGRMYIIIPKGKHSVYARLYNTGARTIGNLASLFSWIGLLTFPIWRKRR